MGFSPAEAIIAILLLAAIVTGLLLMAQIRRLRAGHEAFRRALGQSATVLAAAEAGVRDLSVHGSQMLVALDHAIEEAREIDHSLSSYVEQVRAMPWLPPLAALNHAGAPLTAAVTFPQSAPQPVQAPPPAAPMAHQPPFAHSMAAHSPAAHSLPAQSPGVQSPAYRPPPATVAEPPPFHPAFVSRQPPEPHPPAVVETLADRLKARAAGQGRGWGVK